MLEGMSMIKLKAAVISILLLFSLNILCGEGSEGSGEYVGRFSGLADYFADRYENPPIPISNAADASKKSAEEINDVSHQEIAAVLDTTQALPVNGVRSIVYAYYGKFWQLCKTLVVQVPGGYYFNSIKRIVFSEDDGVEHNQLHVLMVPYCPCPRSVQNSDDYASQIICYVRSGGSEFRGAVYKKNFDRIVSNVNAFAYENHCDDDECPARPNEDSRHELTSIVCYSPGTTVRATVKRKIVNGYMPKEEAEKILIDIHAHSSEKELIEELSKAPQKKKESAATQPGCQSSCVIL